MTNDLSLVVQVAASGSRRAFDELVRRYQSPVRRFFLHQTLGDDTLSDDLAQDTFVKAYMNIGSFRGMSSFQTWLMRIAYNVFYDYTRKMRNEKIVMRYGNEAVSNGCEAYFHSSVSHTSLNMDLCQALSLLKADERTCITLQLIDGYDIKKVAEITGMKEGTVKSHLSRGKEKLANYLKKNGYDRR